MRAEEIKGLMEAYSKIHETPEVLNEEVVEEDLEQLMERGAPTDPKARAAYDAQVAKNRAALGNTLLFGNPKGRKPATLSTPINVRGGRPSTSKSTQSALTGRVSSTNDIASLRRGQEQARQNQLAAASKKEGLGGNVTPTSKEKPAKTRPTTSPAPKPAATAAAKPAAPAAAKPAAAPAPKPAEAPKKTFNPLMQKTFGYQTGYAPDQVKGNIKKMAQMASLKSISAGVDIFDLVKGHLLDEGYADSEEGAMVIMVNMSEEWRKSILESYGVELDESSYSAKAARAGKDIGKPGKMFGKIAKEAGERYGSEERGKKVAGAVLAKLRKEEVEEIDEAQEAREKPEEHEEKEEKENEKKYGHVRGEKTPMPPRGDKRREEFEKWYAKQMGR